jgi:hypothetical protein
MNIQGILSLIRQGIRTTDMNKYSRDVYIDFCMMVRVVKGECKHFSFAVHQVPSLSLKDDIQDEKL